MWAALLILLGGKGPQLIDYKTAAPYDCKTPALFSAFRIDEGSGRTYPLTIIVRSGFFF